MVVEMVRLLPVPFTFRLEIFFPAASNTVSPFLYTISSLYSGISASANFRSFISVLIIVTSLFSELNSTVIIPAVVRYVLSPAL